MTLSDSPRAPRMCRVGRGRHRLGVVTLVIGLFAAAALVVVPDASTPTAQASVRWRNVDATAVTLGYFHTCAIESGVVFCWGRGDGGLLGYVAPAPPLQTPPPTADTAEAVKVNASNGFQNAGGVTAISAGAGHTCAIENGMVFCWGGGASGQLGHGQSVSFVSTPVKAKSVAGGFQNNGSVSAVATSTHSTCAIEQHPVDGGVLYCWGANGLGSVGDGTTTHRNTPTKVASVAGGFQNRNVTHVAGTCAIANGVVYCWGPGGQGQLGNGTTERYSATPVPVSSVPGGFTNSSVDSLGTSKGNCASRNGIMYCWGSGGYGNLGIGTQTSAQTTPVSVSAANGMANSAVSALSAGGTTCGVEHGVLYCWGANSAGQVGDNSRTARTRPVKVLPGGGFTNQAVTTVASWDNHTCAIENRTVYCWGNAANGRLGHGVTTGLQLTPVIASTLPGAPTITEATVGITTATVTVAQGSGAVPTGYTVTAEPGASTCTVTPPATSCTLTGLTSSTTYTFTATATSEQGTSPASAAVTRTTGAVAVPGTPDVTVGLDVIEVTPVPGNGGGTPTGYVVTSTPDGGTCTVEPPAASCTLQSTNGSVSAITTTAYNDAGASDPSGSTTVTVGATTTPDAPNVSVGNRSATVSVSPAASGGTATTYTVTASAAGQPTRTCTVEHPATTCVFEGLTNGITYTFITAATNLAGTSVPSAPVTAVVDLLPEPSKPSVELGATGVTVSVAVSPDGGTVQSHTVHLEPGGHTCTVIAPAQTCFVPLTTQMAYTVTTTATNGVGTSGASELLAFVFGVPLVPGVTVEAIDLGEVTVRVDPDTGGGVPSSYEVFVGAESCIITVPANSCTITGLPSSTVAPFTTYLATASATNGLGTGPASTGTPVRLEPPVAPTFDPDPGDSVTVGFQSATVSVSPVTTSGMPSQFTVTASAAGHPTRTCTVAAPATRCTITGLTNGVTYEFSAEASNAYGSSSVGITTTVALVDALPLPLAPTVTVGADTLTVGVSSSSEGGTVERFTVYAEPGGFTCTVMRPTTSSCVVPGVGQGSLVAGTLYRVTTTATNTIGTSAASTLTTAWFDPPSRPTVDGLTLGLHQVTVSITPGPEASSGPAAYFTVFVGPRSCTITPPATSCSIDGLADGQAYAVTASATNGKGESQPSNGPAARLYPPAAPPAPTVEVFDGGATITIIPPDLNDVPRYYTVTASAVNDPSDVHTCTIVLPSVTCSIVGLTNDEEYVVEAVAISDYPVVSAPSEPITALVAEPAVPLAPVVLPGNGQATVTVRPGNGGGVVASFVVNVDGADVTCSVVPPATRCVLEGLTNGVAYVVTVLAANGVGSTTVSAAATVIPEEPRAALPPGIGGLVTQPVPTTVPPTTTAPSTPPTTRPTTTTVPSTAPVPLTPPPLVPGESVVIDNGEPVPVQVVAVSPTAVAVRGGGFELVVEATCASACPITANAEGQPVIQLEDGGGVRVSGAGFRPGSVASVWLFSTPRLLGTVVVNPDGTFAGTVTLGDLEPGEHTLQVNGISATGTPRSANLGVVVNGGSVPTPGLGRLPATGTGSSDTLLAWAVLLMLAGVVVLGRRRVW